MHDDLEKILFTHEQIHQRIQEVAAEISRDYAGRELMLVTVLKGAVFFLTHLAEALEVPVLIDFLGIASFSPGRALPGVVRISKDLDLDILDKDVLVIEDISISSRDASRAASRSAPFWTKPRAGWSKSP
jgi:hypoxanthine phosphoribosyltransferase